MESKRHLGSVVLIVVLSFSAPGLIVLSHATSSAVGKFDVGQFEFDIHKFASNHPDNGLILVATIEDLGMVPLGCSPTVMETVTFRVDSALWGEPPPETIRTKYPSCLGLGPPEFDSLSSSDVKQFISKYYPDGLIVVATIEDLGVVPSGCRPGVEETVTFQVDRVLRGKSPPKTIQIKYPACVGPPSPLFTKGAKLLVFATRGFQDKTFYRAKGLYHSGKFGVFPATESNVNAVGQVFWKMID